MKAIHSVFSKSTLVTFGIAGILMAQPPGGRGPGMGFGFGGGMGAGVGLQSFLSRTVTGAPFSAKLTIQSVQVLANGNQIQQQEQADVYRDGQGRARVDATVTRPASSGSQTQTQITIYDPVGGSLYRLNPQNMTGVQMALPAHNPRSGGRTPPSNPDVQTKDLGTQTINGVSATGTQITRTIPAGTIGNAQPIQIVRVTWVSTVLQLPVQVTITDPRSGTTAMNLTGIVQSEPNSSLFVVPSGYTLTSGRPRGGPGPRRR